MDGNGTQPVEDRQATSEIPLEILFNKRRRYTVYCLQRYQTPIALADLADEVARLEYNAQTLTQVPKEDVAQIYFDLYHCHIPKMETEDLVEYTQERDTVRLLQAISGININTSINL